MGKELELYQLIGRSITTKYHKTLLRRLKRDNPNIEKSIFNSIHTVSLDTFPGNKRQGKEHSFLEGYGQ